MKFVLEAAFTLPKFFSGENGCEAAGW